jgi:hypothetical protein
MPTDLMCHEERCLGPAYVGAHTQNLFIWSARLVVYTDPSPLIFLRRMAGVNQKLLAMVAEDRPVRLGHTIHQGLGQSASQIPQPPPASSQDGGCRGLLLFS